MRHLVIAILLAASSTTALADIYSDGASAALREHNGIIADFSQLSMNQRVQNALNNLILSAANALEQSGYDADARNLRDEWAHHYAFALTDQFSTMDLGDHTPLSAWLGKTYKNLDDKLGTPVMKALHLDDINVINYGIPVALQPRGDRRNGDHWNKIEYSRHFIPLITVVTFWSSLIACNVATGGHPAVHKWCSVIAMICRNGMQSLYAGKLSDYVYNKFGSKQGEFLVDFSAINARYERQFATVPRE